jgi:hypothetical protein
MNKSITQKHGMLKAAEEGMKSSVDKDVLVVRKAKFMKRNFKGKVKGNGNRNAKGKGKVLPRLKNNQKDDLCDYCNKPGHWKRNCNLFLEEEKKKGNVITSLCILLFKLICLLQHLGYLTPDMQLTFVIMWRDCKRVGN